MFASLASRDYRRLWLSQTCYAGALWMEQIARPWLVLLLTDDDPVHVGGVVALQTLPQLVLGLFAGVTADAVSRKAILVVTKGFVLCLNVVFATLLLTGAIELWHVYAAAFLRGASMAFDQPARQSLIASLVPVRLLTNAVALMSSTQSVMRILGITLAGAIIALVGIERTWVVIALVLTGAVVAVARLEVPDEGRSRTRIEDTRALFQELVSGARFALSRAEIRGVLLLSLVYFSFGLSYLQVFLPLFARFELDVGALGLSLLGGASAVGALCGALLIAHRRPLRLGLLLGLVVTTMGLGLVSYALAWSLPAPFDVALVLPLLVFVGLTQTSYFSLSHATLLSASPAHMRGRVISLLSLGRATVTLGASLGGFLAGSLGAQRAQVIYGVALTAAGVVALTSARGLSRYRLSPDEERGEDESPDEATAAVEGERALNRRRRGA